MQREMAYDTGHLMRSYVESQIATRRAKLQDLDRQKLTVEAELRAYEEMARHLDEPASLAKPKLNGAMETPPANSGKSSSIPTEMTPAWRKILAGVEGLGRAFDAADILKVSADVGEPTKMDNARSQLYQWDQKSIVQRVRRGKYRLTPKGHEAIRKGRGSDASTPEPSQ